jgi:hypothetical protein
MITSLFLLFSISWLLFLVWRFQRFCGKKVALGFSLVMGIWLLYVSILTLTGTLTSPGMPPRLLLLLVPILAFAVWLIRSTVAKFVAGQIPLRELVGLQAFRIVVELFLNELSIEGLMPKAMTFHGQNFDILIGLSALLLYLLWNRIPNLIKVLKVWNILGLGFLANVVVTGILSAPGPLHLINLNQPNLAITRFPYVFIAALFVLSALGLHILALSNLARAAAKK